MQPEVSSLCREAAAVASDVEPETPAEGLIAAEVELAASLMGTRAFLTQNKDAEAFHMAQQCLEVARKSFSGAEDQRWQGLVLSHAIAALAQHAACDMDAASESFDEVISLADHGDQRTGPSKQRDHFIPQALKQVASFRLAQRRVEEALTLASRAAEAARQEAQGARTTPEGGSIDPMLQPTITSEAVADCLLLQAQCLIEEKDWEKAEARLSEALSAVEQLSSPHQATHIRIAFILLPLAFVYSRTGRVTLAEGLYREISKIMRITPSSAESVEVAEVHPSIGALAAWRYAQLLTALPRRGSEADGWHKLAKDLYDDAPLKRVLEPATVFGTLDNLQGKGAAGYGVVLDLMTRRALPKVPPNPEDLPRP